MALSFGASGGSAEDSTGLTSYNVSMSGASAGQICVMDAYTGGTVTWPTGWSVLINATPGGFTVSAGTAVKILNSTDISSGVTLTTSISSYWAVGWSSYSGSSPSFDQVAYSVGSASSLSMSLTTSNSSDWLVGGSLAYSPGGSWGGTTAIGSGRFGTTWLSSAVPQVFDTGATVAQGPYTETFTGSGGPVVFARVVALTDVSAPAAPTLGTPTNGTYESLPTLSCSAVYNSTDSQNQNAYAARLKSTGGYTYYNAGLGHHAGHRRLELRLDCPERHLHLVLPVFGHIQWGHLQLVGSLSGGRRVSPGPFASDFTVVGQAAPTLVVNGPTGTVLVPDPPSLGRPRQDQGPRRLPSGWCSTRRRSSP